jgi:hypothetical protein
MQKVKVIISKNRNVPNVLQIFMLCFFALFSISTNVAAEVVTKDIHLFVYYGGGDRDTLYAVDDKEVFLKAGEIRRREVTSFEEGSDVAVEDMDLEFDIYNRSSKLEPKVEVQLEIIPKVARIKYIEGGPAGAINEKETSANASWLNSTITRSKIISNLKSGSYKKVIFDKIRLNDIINSYLKNEHWPTALKFVITVKYDSKKQVQSRVLAIPFRTY